MARIATSIEESKRLLELGIDSNTADMRWYREQKWFPYELQPYPYNESIITDGNESMKPAWSLGALLEVLQEYDLTKFVETECSFLCYCKGGDKLVYSPTPIDACVKMIELIAKEEDISKRRNDYGTNSL